MKLLTITKENSSSSEIKFKELERELLLFAEVQGENNGTENKPLTESEFKALFLNKVESKIQSVIDGNQQEHLPVSGMVVAQQSKIEAGEKVRPLAAGLKDKEHEFRRLEECKKDCTPDLRLRNIRKVVYAGALLIAIAESFFAYEALRRVPLGKAPCFITAIGITIALAFGTHILAGYIKKAQTRLQFITRFCISTIPVFIGFYVLGNLRTHGYAVAAQMNLDVHQQAAAQPGVSGLGITILSFLLFLAALIFSIRYYKTEQEEENDIRYDKACRELSKYKKNIEEIRAMINKVQEKATIQSADALTRYEFALATENRLMALGRQVIQEYILKNLCYRTDGITPAFFSDPPQLHIRLFFDNLKNDKS